uniref:Uncharacterized protein n=1 Tax=Cucumis melo TaxID=3656 RepID=A0A9I9EHS8_CUCME
MQSRKKPEAERFPLELGVAWYSTGRDDKNDAGKAKTTSFFFSASFTLVLLLSGLQMVNLSSVVDTGLGTAAAKCGCYTLTGHTGICEVEYEEGARVTSDMRADEAVPRLTNEEIVVSYSYLLQLLERISSERNPSMYGLTGSTTKPRGPAGGNLLSFNVALRKP